MFSLQVEASVNNLLSFGLIFVHCYFITAVDSKKSQDIPEKDQETFEKECYFFFYSVINEWAHAVCVDNLNL